MNLAISAIWETSQALTHAGVFHADDVMAAAILSHCGIRTLARAYSAPEGLPEGIVVFDIGGGEYDHHMPGGNGFRANGVRYSSCGLIWQSYGRSACADILGFQSEECIDDVWDAVDKSLIQSIDAADNGIGHQDEAGISAMISDFNPAWNSEEDGNALFLRAAEFADEVLIRRVRSVGSSVQAHRLVSAALDQTAGQVLVLDRYLPWRDVLNADPRGEAILFVVYPAVRGGYNCQCVPPSGAPFEQKQPLPQKWRGLSQEALRAETGVRTALFCHPGGFLCGAETREDAVRLAMTAIQRRNDAD